MASPDAFEQLLAVTRLTQQFRGVERQVLLPGSDRLENDAEHSFQLAMLAWYIVERENLPLDRGTVLQYALAHDLVEVYAGDVFFYDTDSPERKNKEEREEQARQRLKREFPEWETLHESIAAYEERRDAESRFIYALDKVAPILNIYLDNGRLWKRHGISLHQLVSLKREKVKRSDAVTDYFDMLVAALQKEEPELFPDDVDENGKET